MSVSPTDQRPLLGAGFWLAASAAVLTGIFGVFGGSSIGLALACQLVLVSVSAWAVRDLHAKRSSPDAAKAVQTETIVVACAAVIVGLVAAFQLLQQLLGGEPQESGGVAFGAICLAGAFVWLVLARSLQATPRAELPEAEPLSHAFREVQWSFLLAAGALVGAGFVPALAMWLTRGLLVWVLALCVETLVRSLAPIFVPTNRDSAPVYLLLREAVFATGNPVGSMLRTLDTRYGLSLRSSWALTFTKRAALPMLLLMVLLYWASTSVAVVGMGQLGVREEFGRVGSEPLQPGLHFNLPWPCGRIRTFAVKAVHQVPIGFIEKDTATMRNEPAALLWTRGHTKEEFALVLGGGTELVVVNALLYYKIAEDERGFMDYVYRQASPEAALVDFAYRALTEETQGRSLEEVLSADRTAFARRLADSVRAQAREARLGLEVVDFALINLHPPIEAAGSYLDVINARLDAQRRVTEARGKKDTDLLAADTASATKVASARTDATRLVTNASSQTAEFMAVGEASRVAPETNRYRLWAEALEKALADQRLYVIDRSLLADGGELILDTRRQPMLQLPGFPASGAKKP